MFIDEVRIYVKGGDGGDGCVSFRREKFVPRGGPNGGDGGKGGNVIIRANKNIDTLLDITSKVKFLAEDGGKGQNSNKNGKDGRDLIINVPKGTLIKDLKTGRIIKDLKGNDVSITIARGGRRGRGNAYFKSPTDQTPRFAEEGRNGQERWLRLELKLIADIGIIGLPNAGKSTFLSRISSARPKIADYPFTTLQPQLGIVELEDYKRLVFADIPGLIEGAHSGSGLGNTFLRHIERTRVVVHLIDISVTDLLKTYNLVRKELALFSSKLSEKAEIVAINKSDILDMETSRIMAEDLSKKISKPVHLVSAVSGNNVKSLIKSAADLIDKENEEELSYLSFPTDNDAIGKKGLTF
ncbi:MAG: GTPase ObgE [Planctomycetota bacterium]|jgi:GTP-binding protein